MLKIKEIREAKNLSQDAIVERTGIPKRSYVNYENEKTDIPFSKLVKIAVALGVKVPTLIESAEEEVQDIANEPGLAYPNNGFQKMTNAIRGDLKTLHQGMQEKFELLSDGVFHILKDTTKINRAIDDLDIQGLKKTGKALQKLINERK